MNWRREKELPMVANLRCGGWYVPPPELLATTTTTGGDGTTAYFKSTDGHRGKWDFNLRRANLHLLPLLNQHGGCTLVDSTQKGKTMPDSFSRTVPIFCATINTAVNLFLRREGLPTSLSDHPARVRPDNWDTSLHTPPRIVSSSEKVLIQERILEFAQKLLDSGTDMIAICQQVRKPLRPIWISPSSRTRIEFRDSEMVDSIELSDTPDDSYPEKKENKEEGEEEVVIPNFLERVEFYPVVCLTASDPKLENRSLTLEVDGVINRHQRQQFIYNQGAGDDEEMWSKGLTPELLWSELDTILNYDPYQSDSFDQHLDGTIQRNRINLHAPAKTRGTRVPFDFIGTTGLAIGSWQAGRPPDCWTYFDIVINCTEHPHPSDLTTHLPTGKSYFFLDIPEGKKGQHRLFASLPSILDKVGTLLTQWSDPNPIKILCHCAQGVDRSVGIALAILTRFLAPTGTSLHSAPRPLTTKDQLHRTLHNLILPYRVQAHPSRTTLKRVTQYFQTPPPTPLEPNPSL